MKRVVGSLMLAIAIPVAIAAQQQQGKVAYPTTKTIAHIDDYFGRKVADPYRWMEDLNAPDVAQWVKAENAVTERYLATLPMRERFKSRITELWNYPKVELAVPRSGQAVLHQEQRAAAAGGVSCARRSTAPEQLVIDPNVLSPDGSVALSLFAPSPDGKLVRVRSVAGRIGLVDGLCA